MWMFDLLCDTSPPKYVFQDALLGLPSLPPSFSPSPSLPPPFFSYPSLPFSLSSLSFPSLPFSFSLSSCSYFFLEFSTRNEAVAAVTTGNGYKLDKAHVFATNFFSDFET